MTSFPRYAIYYAPDRESPLDRFGARLLGYDVWTGEDLTFPEFATQAAPDWRDLTHDPRKYGFHATLKAPMPLATGCTEAELAAACAAVAAKPRAIPVIIPVVESISGFIAIVPSQPCSELGQLAADCVVELDMFRKAMTAEDRARRNPAALTPRQCELLDRWGYPYVMEQFRFHMTLTGRLHPARRAPVLAMLQQRFSEIDLPQMTVDRIALFGQNDATSRFRIISQWRLRDADRGKA